MNREGAAYWMPRLRVWSRRIGQSFGWSEIAEAFEPGSIVVVDEAVEEAVTVFGGYEVPMPDAALGLASNSLGDSTVKALDQTIGLRPIRPGQAVVDMALGAEAIKGMPARGPIKWLVLQVDGEAVGELTAIVGQDRVNSMGEVLQEASQELGRGVGVTVRVDFHIGVAGGTIDGHEGVLLASLQGRKMLQIDMNEANGGLFEYTDCRLVRLGSLVQAVTSQASVSGAARDLLVDATPHDLDDIVERQLQAAPQFADQRFFERQQLGCQPFWRVGAVVDRGAPAPAADRRLTDTEFCRKFGNRALAALDVGSDLRRGGGVGMQVQLHDPRRSLMNEMPLSTPIPSNQSPGTKHMRGV